MSALGKSGPSRPSPGTAGMRRLADLLQLWRRPRPSKHARSGCNFTRKRPAEREYGEQGRTAMNLQWRNFPLVLTFATAFVTPALGQSQSAQHIPDLSGIWEHANPGFEPLASGPTALINRSRRANGTGDGLKLTGDYTNPILKPQAAETVKRHGERAVDLGEPNPHNQCWLEGPPFVFTNHPN